jgi:Na+-transporting NADH:ubiquinone oxidoreductase subunit NqrA
LGDRRREVLRKGLDLPIPGAPLAVIEEGRAIREVALLGSDLPRLRLAL